MAAVLEQLARVHEATETEAVHDLRVAIRRCRAVAAAMREVDPHPAWRAMRREARSLFRALGALRDAQVLEEWVEKVTTADNPVRQAYLDTLKAREGEAVAQVRMAIQAFDRKAWRRLSRRLSSRVRLVRPNGAVAQCVALERFAEVRRLHARALRTERPKPWHELRIAVKQFRYVVEIFLPARYETWEPCLKQVQDLLGQIHDLDVLYAFSGQDTTTAEPSAVASLRESIQRQRKQCMAEYQRHTRGRKSALRAWRAGLPQGSRIEAATGARFRATACALDPRVRRTMRVSRLALQLLDLLVTPDGEPPFGGARTRLLLRAAARLHGVRCPRGRGPRQERAYEFLRGLPAPVGWKPAEWEILAWTVRYHRGAEPKPSHTAFAQLPADRQAQVRALAGVLRLARALNRSGATALAQPTGENAGDLRLRARGLVDDRKNAARIAAAKHLLEGCLCRHVIIDSG